MRRSEDGYKVAESEYVYEILYRYLNPEISIAEPDSRRMKHIPREIPIWKKRNNCQKVCDQINKHKTKL